MIWQPSGNKGEAIPYPPPPPSMHVLFSCVIQVHWSGGGQREVMAEYTARNQPIYYLQLLLGHTSRTTDIPFWSAPKAEGGLLCSELSLDKRKREASTTSWDLVNSSRHKIRPF